MLARLRKSTDENDQGFTLIELLVVVIIIGILAAIAIPTFLSQRENGWRAQVTSDIRNAVTNAEAYAVGQNGEYSGFTAVEAQEGIAATNTRLGVAGVTATGFCITGVSLSGGGSVQLNYLKSRDTIEEGVACTP